MQNFNIQSGYKTCDTPSALQIEIINTGSELMLGRVLNTHQQWLCRQLADLGYAVSRQIAVADSGPAIQQAVRQEASRVWISHAIRRSRSLPCHRSLLPKRGASSICT